MTADTTNGGGQESSGDKESTADKKAEQEAYVHDLPALDVEGAAGVDDADT